MKYFLASFEIRDGEHEHSGEFIVKATTIKKAWKMAEKEQHDVFDKEHGKTYWDYGDGTTASRLKNMTEIEKKEAETLSKLGVAYFYN